MRLLPGYPFRDEHGLARCVGELSILCCFCVTACVGYTGSGCCDGLLSDDDCISDSCCYDTWIEDVDLHDVDVVDSRGRDSGHPDDIVNDRDFCTGLCLPDSGQISDVPILSDSGEVVENTVDECRYDGDCPWGFKCSENLVGVNKCVFASECELGSSCKDSNEKCAEGSNWYVCVSVVDECYYDNDCAYGKNCDLAIGRPHRCVDADECSVGNDCDEGQSCVPGEHWLICSAVEDDCSTDEDCPYDRGCITETSPNQCVWKSTCHEDADCNPRVCKRVGNWSECRWGPNFCASDSDCPPFDLCDMRFVFFGLCVYVDELY